MASDQVVIALGLLAVAGPIAVVVIDKVSQWRVEKQRQAHELRRDQQTRRYEFRLQEYRERREACQSLLAAIYHTSTFATVRHRVSELLNKSRSEESIAAANADIEAAMHNRTLAEKYTDEALAVGGYLSRPSYTMVWSVRNRLANSAARCVGGAGRVRHRYELVREATRRKNKLTAICNELFPEFTTLFKDPNAAGALALREAFPTPHAVATATQADLVAMRVGTHPSTTKLRQLHAVAATSIGVHDLGRQRGLVLEQRQLIRELRLLQTHMAELEAEIGSIVATSREGRILTSIPVIGPLQAVAILAAIGHIDNFASAGALRAYCGWAPQVKRSGETVDQVKLTRGGTRTMKQTLYLVVANAIQRPECEWARLYLRLVPRKCSYDERRQRYIGTNKVLARIAGQLISTIYALLKRDAEVLAQSVPGHLPPEPVLYDPAIHKAHREGRYRSSKPQRSRSIIMALPTRTGI